MNHKRVLIASLAAALLLAGCGEPPATEDASPAEPTTEPMEEPQAEEPAAQTDDAATPDGGNGEAAGGADRGANDERHAVPDAIAQAVAHPERPEEDQARDGDRKPDRVLAFFGLEPEMTVLEFIAGGGYYTEILSRAVGESGRIHATRLDEERIADDRLPNVTAAPDRDWDLEPASVDMVFTALNYHDLFNIEDLDRSELLARFYELLRPGGTFAVVDHAAEQGSGTRDTDTLHRIEEAVVVSDVTDAGFELADESSLLRHPEDDRTQAVFDEGIRGQTDRFVLKFVKPEE